MESLQISPGFVTRATRRRGQLVSYAGEGRGLTLVRQSTSPVLPLLDTD